MKFRLVEAAEISDVYKEFASDAIDAMLDSAASQEEKSVAEASIEQSLDQLINKYPNLAILKDSSILSDFEANNAAEAIKILFELPGRGKLDQNFLLNWLCTTKNEISPEAFKAMYRLVQEGEIGFKNKGKNTLAYTWNPDIISPESGLSAEEIYTILRILYKVDNLKAPLPTYQMKLPDQQVHSAVIKPEIFFQEWQDAYVKSNGKNDIAGKNLGAWTPLPYDQFMKLAKIAFQKDATSKSQQEKDAKDKENALEQEAKDKHDAQIQASQLVIPIHANLHIKEGESIRFRDLPNTKKFEVEHDIISNEVFNKKDLINDSSAQKIIVDLLTQESCSLTRNKTGIQAVIPSGIITAIARINYPKFNRSHLLLLINAANNKRLNLGPALRDTSINHGSDSDPNRWLYRRSFWENRGLRELEYLFNILLLGQQPGHYFNTKYSNSLILDKDGNINKTLDEIKRIVSEYKNQTFSTIGASKNNAAKARNKLTITQQHLTTNSLEDEDAENIMDLLDDNTERANNIRKAIRDYIDKHEEP